MPTIEQLFADIRKMSPQEIEVKIADHRAQVKVLLKRLLMIRETKEPTGLAVGFAGRPAGDTTGNT